RWGRRLGSADFPGPRAAAVAAVQLDGNDARLVAQGGRNDFDRQARIGANVELQPAEIARLRLDRENAAMPRRARCDEQREQTDIGADIDEREGAAVRLRPRDVGLEFAELLRFVHARREQQVLFAAVVAWMQPQAQAPALDIERTVR